LKNVEAVFVGSGPNAVRRFIAPYWEDMIVSEMTNSHIAESCTIPPHGNGVMLNAKVRDEEVMRFVHEILHTFGASLTEKDQGSTDHTYRLVSIGISKVDSVGTQSSGMPETSSHIKSPDSLGADSAKSECCSGGQLYPLDTETVCPDRHYPIS